MPNPNVLMQLARQHEQARNLVQAESCYRQIVAEHPAHHAAWHRLGLLAHRAGNVTLAIQCIEAAIATHDKIAAYHRNLGEMYRRQGNVEKAIRAGRRACKLAPRDLDAHYNLGLAYTDAHDFTNAVKCYESALKIDERHGLSWNNLGSSLERLDQRSRAQLAYQRAIEIDPRHAEAQNNLGVIYSKLGEVDAARACFEAAIAARPEFSEAQHNLAGISPLPHRSAEDHHVEGVALYGQGRMLDALACYDRALALRAEFPEALNSRGFVLQDLHRLEEALACFERAVQLSPQMAMARLNLGMLQLKLGQWQAGWENYEARWTGSAEAGRGNLQRIVCPLPHWEGQANTKEKNLLVITEQGFGDCFQFVRYLPLAQERFAKVGMLCSAPTQRLLEWSWGESITMLTHVPTDFSGWDLQCSLLSLPRAFGTRLDTIPARVPYLRATPAALEYWRQRMENAAPHRLRVGVAWAGRRTHQRDARRSLRFEQLRPLFTDSRVAWFSLQKWAPQDARPDIPAELEWIDWTEELDFADTAAVIHNLDLVISVDSSMVHLTGALGRPVWLLNRYDGEWRWLHLRTDSPWYPSLRIFNQPTFGDWDSVLAAVRQALAAFPVPRKIEPRTTSRGAPQAVRAAEPLAQREALSSQRALQLAAELQGAGRLQEAQQLLHQVLKAEPRNAHALHLLGVVAWSAGQQQQAIPLIEQAIVLDERCALFHCNLGEMLRQQGKLAAAVEHGLRATQLDPASAIAHANLGIAYYDLGNYDNAEACQQRALALAPQLVTALNNLGSLAHARKDLPAAVTWYRKTLAVQPEFVEALSNLAAVLLEQDEVAAAEQPALRALEINPHCAEALCNLGLVRFKQHQHTEAQQLLERALQLKPGYPEALIGLALLMRERQRLQDAIPLLQQCLSHHPQKLDAWCLLAAVHAENLDTPQAELAYQKALALDPHSSDALAGLGNLRLEQGKIAAAEELLKQAIVLDANHLGARFHLMQTRTITPDDANLAALEALLPTATTLSADKCISLHYALGKAYDDLRDWERAFPHFLEGARLKRAQLEYDADLDAARVQRVIALTSAASLSRLRGAGNPSDVPVFVLGMPRSGTTLTEQIIASHPQVHGAGELRDLMLTLHELPSDLGRFPENLASLTPERLTAWGTEYVRRLRAHAPEAARVTDKMPANYLLLGVIPLLLPNAKIIHVRRNPVDTCVSCFTRLFNRHQDATYDLHELGRHYAAYARLMQHWHAVMPAGSYLEVQYEDIVADIDTQARRLIDWVGLPWHDACLEFHKTERNIRTASVTQVRQPIYSHSVERWRHYAKFLGPLLDGLGEFAPADATSKSTH